MNDSDKTNFAKKLSHFRNLKGLTQIQLAEITGISQRMIAYYETNASNPPLEKINVIANALDIEVEKLIGNKPLPELKNKIEKDNSLNIDPRSLEKIKMILSLPKDERHIIYNMAEAFIAKRKLKQLEESQDQQ